MHAACELLSKAKNFNVDKLHFAFLQHTSSMNTCACVRTSGSAALRCHSSNRGTRPNATNSPRTPVREQWKKKEKMNVRQYECVMCDWVWRVYVCWLSYRRSLLGHWLRLKDDRCLVPTESAKATARGDKEHTPPRSHAWGGSRVLLCVWQYFYLLTHLCVRVLYVCMYVWLSYRRSY